MMIVHSKVQSNVIALLHQTRRRFPKLMLCATIKDQGLPSQPNVVDALLESLG